MNIDDNHKELELISLTDSDQEILDNIRAYPKYQDLYEEQDFFNR
jgi:hypothetical protein